MSVVNHPTHYQSASIVCSHLLRLHLGLTPDDLEMECIKFLKANNKYRDFHIASAIKYLWRCGNKGEAQPDMQKALWCLLDWREIDNHEWKLLFFSALGGISVLNEMEFAVSDLILALEKQIALNP